MKHSSEIVSQRINWKKLGSICQSLLISILNCIYLLITLKFLELQAPGNSFIYIYPIGLQKLLEFMNLEYQSPTIYITENGCSLFHVFSPIYIYILIVILIIFCWFFCIGITEKRGDSLEVTEALKDPYWINNILRHLHKIHAAMQ